MKTQQMKSDRKTKNELIEELESSRRKVKKLETLLKQPKHTEQNIIERKRAEEALRESEERGTKAFRFIPDALVISRLEDGKIVEVNDSWHKVFEYSREEVVGKSSLALNLFADSTDRQRAIALLREQGFVRDFEFQLRQKSGALRTATLSIELLKIHGEQYLLSIVNDITERKRIEESLQESEIRFRSLYENSTIGLYRTTPDGEIILGNPALIGMLGYSSFKELAARNLEQEGFEPSYERKHFIEKIELNGEIKGLESAWTHRDGSTVYIRESARVIRDSDGKTLYYDGSVEDITERKRAEKRLRESELKFRTVADYTYDWEYWENENNEIEYISPSCERITGYSPQKFIEDPSLLKKIVHPEDYGYVKQHDERLFITEHKHNIDELDFRIIHKDGSVVHIHHVCRPIFDESNKYHGRRISNRDITKRKRTEEALEKSEEKFHLLFQNNQSMIGLSTLKDGRYIDVNDEFLRVTQFSREEVIGLTAFELGIWESLKQRDQLVEDLQKQDRVHNVEMRIRTKSGSIRTLLCNIELLVFEGELCFLVSAIDNTERKRSEEEIRKSHKELRLLADHLQNIREEERKRLAREFHDQFGQSMTALKMDLSLLLRTISDEKQDISRKNIAKELKSAQNLIDEMSRSIWVIIADLRPQMLDDLGLLAALEWETEGFESRTGIRCNFKSVAGDIQMDSKKSIALFRIYQEVLTNISRHAHATVVKSVLRRDGEMLVFEVKDNGSGITHNKQFKSDSFGLIGMRERALALGGQLEISGIAGEGTTIIVQLPL